MPLNARRPGGLLESAGWRPVPHFHAPCSWGLPVDPGLVTEIAFQNASWSHDSRTVEIIQVIEWRLSRIQVGFDPAFERVLRGPEANRG